MSCSVSLCEKHRFKRNTFCFLRLKRGCMTVKLLLRWPAECSQELKSQHRPPAIPANGFESGTVCSSLSQRSFMPSANEPLRQMLAQAPCLAVLCGTAKSGCKISETGVAFLCPCSRQRTDSLSHRQVELTSAWNPHLLLPRRSICSFLH